MISTISFTMLVGVKNSPPFCPSDMANLPRKYSTRNPLILGKRPKWVSDPGDAPPLVAMNPPAPAPQSARGPEALKLFGRHDDDRSAVFIASGPPDARAIVHCPDTLRP